MRTDFSEFSFGYALTEEFMNTYRAGISVAPIFPSLIEEGRAGGGYDVRFELSGIVVLIQFKRPDVMVSTRAWESQDPTIALQPIFYRMHIRSSSYSQQHDLLLGQDTGSALVLYASPCFHDIMAFNGYYVGRTVISNTIFVRPRDIGRLSAEPHHLAYDNTGQAWLCSEPEKFPSIVRGEQILEKIGGQLRQETRALNEGPLAETLTQLRQALPISARLVVGADAPERLTPKDQLREIVEIGTSVLNAQVFVIQAQIDRR